MFGGADPLPRPRDLLRALRHPDVSVVIDLSHTPEEVKLAYVRSVLPGLASLRRHTGLPHRIVVDEAHYFLHGTDVSSLIDLELNGYTLTTYRASHVSPALLAATQAVIVTRESDPREVLALFEVCRGCGAQQPEQDWERLFGELRVGEAIVLPLTQEAGGQLRRVRLAPRLTPHVRHLTKYTDMPVPWERAFVFWEGGAARWRARTLRELTSGIDALSLRALAGHLERGDFSRWVADVFGDYPLAAELRQLEARYSKGDTSSAPSALRQAIRARYDVFDPVPRSHS
jgi:hypothetical protein